MTPPLAQFSGAWFEMARTENPYQTLQQCVRNDYQFGTDASWLTFIKWILK